MPERDEIDQISLALSGPERKAGVLAAATLGRGVERFRDLGCLVIPDVLSPAVMAQLALAFEQTYGGLAESRMLELGMTVGEGRVMLPLPLWPPLADTRFYAEPLLLQLLSALLGPELVISSCSMVLALPGAGDQHLHRDNPLLFGQTEASLRVPPYAITLALPLVDLTNETGTTALYPRSQRGYDTPPERLGPPVLPHCRRGDAYLIDYRLLHGGTANLSARPRPVIYISYCRPWYLDTSNYFEQNFPALLVHPRLLAEAPPVLRQLLVRARLEHGQGSSSPPL